ncbi:hypothetical protein HYC85_022482 [Camellia sinensis]|uniref:Uncharacterized protein n=1 Tax=Camellia sinensis TaxID=4442 RepID=A0A7J7GM63_CAMSI|nr:hypothetical protein HYC85_022482 [Camellia sinensis]
MFCAITGVARSNIGRIYKEATEVFKYDYGVLQLTLQAFEEMGLNKSSVIKFVSSCPDLLVGDMNKEFLKVLDKFKSIGIEYGWIEENLIEGNTYNCSHMLELLCLLTNMGCSEEQLGKLICQHPGLLFEASGIKAEMEVQEIGRIVRAHPLLLGSCYLKKLNSLLANLNTGKKRLCDIIKENPLVLKEWVLGSTVKRLPDSGEELRSQMMKTKFLLDLGFVENSNEMRKALRVFRGKGGELHERFDCFVKAGLNRKDVSEIIKLAPQVLNQSKDVIQMKIDFLVNGLGYPPSSLLIFPAYVSYTIQRVKLRCSMYDWLKDQGKVDPKLALSTILSCSDKIFIRRFVNQHPTGPEVWEKLKKQIYPD